jgi:hypothetical protein
MSKLHDNPNDRTPIDQHLDALLGPAPAHPSAARTRGGGPIATRVLVVAGHLPKHASIWLSQYAGNEAREHGSVCILRLDVDAVQVELFVGGGPRPTIRLGASLPEALRAIAPGVASWLVVPRASDPIEVPEDADEVTFLIGPGNAAVVGGYELIKRCVESVRRRDAARTNPRRTRFGVVVVGAAEEEVARAKATLGASTRTFLEFEIPVCVGEQRIAPSEGAFRGTFDVPSPLVADLFAMIRAAEAAALSESVEAASGGARTAPMERFSARPERLAPQRRELPDHRPIPFTRSAPATQGAQPPTRPSMSAVHGNTVVRAPAAMAPGPAAKPHAVQVLKPAPAALPAIAPVAQPAAALREPPARRAPEQRIDLGRTSVAPSVAPSIAPSVAPAISPPKSQIPVQPSAAPRVEPAARPAAGSLPPEPVVPSRARAVEGELPAVLAPELAGLEPIAFRAPREKHIELAIDAEGRLHIVGRASDATAILRVRGWAREHGELLAMADARIAPLEPAIDLVVSDLRDARAIDGATVHVLTLVELGGRRGYLAQIAPM